MRRDRPLLIVTAPGRSIAECEEEIAAARTAGADIVELRIDRWKDGELERARELFSSGIPLMATYRSRAEGGEASDDPAVRSKMQARLGSLGFEWLDLESARDRVGPPGVRAPRAVLSSHLPEGTEPTAVRERLHAGPGGATFVKVVLPSTVTGALRLREALDPAGASAPALLHTTGPSGPLFRATAWRRGFPAIYARLPDGFPRPPVEGSQIPVDAMRHFLDSDSPGPLFALLGHPVGQSRSPAMFAEWMRSRGDHGLYIALDVATEEEFLSSVGPLVDEGFRGFNVTSPWKLAALTVATAVGKGAGECGAANVLTARPGGGLEAENTDLLAVTRRLKEFVDAGKWPGDRLTVIGTGGAARAALAAARSVGARAHLVGRAPAEVERLAREFGAELLGPEAPPGGLVINATSIGRNEAGAPGIALPRLFAHRVHLLDLVYDPQVPIFREHVLARGGSYEDGHRLLVYQAEESYRIWWGHAPPETAAQRALQAGR